MVENKKRKIKYQTTPNLQKKFQAHKRGWFTMFEYYLKSAYLTCEHILIQGFFSFTVKTKTFPVKKWKYCPWKKKCPWTYKIAFDLIFSWQSVREKTKLPITREKIKCLPVKLYFARKKKQNKAADARKKLDL